MVAGGAARWGTCAHRIGSQPLGLRPLGIYRAFGGYGGVRLAGTLGVGLGLGAGLRVVNDVAFEAREVAHVDIDV